MITQLDRSIYLASRSPRRRELLTQIGVRFQLLLFRDAPVTDPELDETVLPGETPVPVPTVPAGTYPDWSGDETYERGQRVLFDGLPYEAKWWTRGDSPQASETEPDSSPWLALDAEDVLAGE